MERGDPLPVDNPPLVLPEFGRLFDWQAHQIPTRLRLTHEVATQKLEASGGLTNEINRMAWKARVRAKTRIVTLSRRGGKHGV